MDVADLFCTEQLQDQHTTAAVGCNNSRLLAMDYHLEVQSHQDRVLIEDSRVLRNMLADERVQQTSRSDYCALVQTQIKPHMRKIVLDWMLEVCDDQQCQAHVFHQAVAYLDRYLTVTDTPKSAFMARRKGHFLRAIMGPMDEKMPL